MSHGIFRHIHLEVKNPFIVICVWCSGTTSKHSVGFLFSTISCLGNPVVVCHINCS